MPSTLASTSALFRSQRKTDRCRSIRPSHKKSIPERLVFIYTLNPTHVSTPPKERCSPLTAWPVGVRATSSGTGHTHRTPRLGCLHLPALTRYSDKPCSQREAVSAENNCSVFPRQSQNLLKSSTHMGRRRRLPQLQRQREKKDRSRRGPPSAHPDQGLFEFLPQARGRGEKAEGNVRDRRRPG